MSLRLKENKYSPEKISFIDFKGKTQDQFEGLVFLGAGGDLDDWVRGVSSELKKEGISIEETEIEDMFTEAYELETTGGRTDLALVFNDEKHPFDIDKLVIWRLKFGECSWISDYLVNYEDQHSIMEESNA